jgi:hypothetical protein
MGEDRKVYTRFWWESQKEKRSLGRPRRRWKDVIGVDVGVIGGGVEWIQVAQDREWLRALVNTVMKLRVLVPRS